LVGSNSSVEFSYTAPTITNIAPSNGLPSGGYDITIIGRNLVPSGYNLTSSNWINAITIDGVPCTRVIWAEDTLAICYVPPGVATGGRTVVSVTVGNQTTSTSSLFSYYDNICTSAFFSTADNRTWNLASVPQSETTYLGYEYVFGTCDNGCLYDGQYDHFCQLLPTNSMSLGRYFTTVVTSFDKKLVITASHGATYNCSDSSSTVNLICTDAVTTVFVLQETSTHCSYEADILVPYSVCGCPNNCIGGGTCVDAACKCPSGNYVSPNPPCTCQPGYYGPNCSYLTNSCGTFVNTIDGRTWDLSSIGTLSTLCDDYVFNLCGVSGCNVGGAPSVACQAGIRSLGQVDTATIAPLAANQIVIQATGGSVDSGCSSRNSNIILNCVDVALPSIVVSPSCTNNFTVSVPLALCGH